MSRPKSTVIHLTVRLELPKGSNTAEAMQYVRDALASHKGGMDPSAPITHLENNQITVNLLKKETVYG